MKTQANEDIRKSTAKIHKHKKKIKKCDQIQPPAPLKLGKES
jgi:hypothetical protein